MRPYALPLCFAAVLALAACSPHSGLNTADKASVTAELISHRPACAAFSQKLAEPGSDARSIDETYRQARAAYCIKPHV